MADNGAACKASARADGGRSPANRSSPRLTRGDLTRQSIAEAAVELILSGTPLPSAAQVAARAGVSVRCVQHHFRHRKELFRAATELQDDRFHSTIGAVPPRGPVEVRVRAVCHQRRLLFESVAPVMWASEFWSRHFCDHHPKVSEYRLRLRRQLAYAFEPEIARGEGERPLLLDGLESVTGWQAWHATRTESRRTATDSERLMVYLVTALLS